MRNPIVKRITAGLAAAMLMFTNVLLPVQPVFAMEGADAADTLVAEQSQPVEEQVDQTEQPLANDESSFVENVVPQVEPQADKKKDDTEPPKGDGKPQPPEERKYGICHRTSSATNPYRYIEVDYNSIVGDSGHDGHDGPVVFSVAEAQQLKDNDEDWGDIIPAVPEWDYNGMNIPDGQRILDAGCKVEGEPIIVQIPVELKTYDPCGLDNIYLITTALGSIENISYVVNSDGSVKVTANEGYILTFNGTTTLETYVYELKEEDRKELCEALSEEPTFVDPCGTTKDYFKVKDTEYVEYYNGDELLKAGKRYHVTDASEVTITAKVTDDDYEIVNQTEYVKQFTDKACVELDAKAWCDNVVDTKIKATVTNTTKMRQAYEVVVTDSEDNELYTKVVLLKKGATEKVYVSVDGDGEFTVSVYNFTKKDGRGTLLEQATVMTECVDTFTPEIYKKNQDGAILSTGTFDVEVCQMSSEFERMVMGEEQDGCTTYEDVMFGTDGTWFANNVEYERNVPTTVTITETKAPVGCAMSTTPWVFTWSYNDIQVMSYYHMSGSWDTVDGTNVFNLYNNCDKPGQGEYTPTPVVPVEDETLAETGESENAILAVAAGMLLASVGLALSPRLYRG